MPISQSLYREIANQYQLDLEGIHGIFHWQRVEKFGLMLAEVTKADLEVISYFSYLHDSKRQDDFEDINHGLRAAEFVGKLYNVANCIGLKYFVIFFYIFNSNKF